MARFYGMIANIDENVGKLRELLAQTGLADDTVFVFTTDNGTAAGDRPRKRETGAWPGYNAGMRGKKGSEYDGGHRVPFFVHWPRGGVTGGRDIEALAAHIDVLPTLTELCGLEARPTVEAGDGASFAPALTDTGPAPSDRTLFVHSQRIEHPKEWRKSAVMTDRWRLVNGQELFDIVADPGQKTDVAGDHPAVVQALRRAYQGWWASLEPAFDDYVRIDLGGAENPTHLMSHDWHQGVGPTPWHQNAVRRGVLGNGPWAVRVVRDGRYRVTLRRWPAHLRRAMECSGASLRIGSRNAEQKLRPDATEAVFELDLIAGPHMVSTTLRRPNGDESGAYFAAVERITDK